MKPEKRTWKKQLAIDIVYYVGLIFLIKIPDFVKYLKRQKNNIDKNLGEKRF